MEFHLIDELQIDSEESNMNNTNELSDALTKYCSDKQYSFSHIFTMWGGDEDVYARERKINGLDSPRVVWGGDEKYDIIFKKEFSTTHEDIIDAVLAFVNECEKLGIYVWEGKYNYKLQGDYCLFKINDNQTVYSRELNTTYSFSK